MTIKPDKRKFSICIASGDTRYFKHMDDKHNIRCTVGFEEDLESCQKVNGGVLTCSKCLFGCKRLGLDKALIEAQKLANKLNKKICVMTSVYNVYPDKEIK